MPACDVPQRPITDLLPADALAASPLPLPELSEPDLTRHFREPLHAEYVGGYAFLSAWLVHHEVQSEAERASGRLPGFADLHPYQPDETLQGMLSLLYSLQEMLAEISGLPGVTLQPAAGAHGELTALLVAAAYFRDLGQKRATVLIPRRGARHQSASAAMAGFQAVQVRTCEKGLVDLEDLSKKLSAETAVFMINQSEHARIIRPSDGRHRSQGT